MASTLCTNASGFDSNNQLDRSKYLPSSFSFGTFQNMGLNTNESEFLFNLDSVSMTGLYMSTVPGPVSSIDGTTNMLGYDNGYGNWVPSNTSFSLNAAELCPCVGMECEPSYQNQMGNFVGPYSTSGLDNYKVAFCSSTDQGGYGCTGLFYNLFQGKIDLDPVTFGSLYSNFASPNQPNIPLSNVNIWRIGDPIPLNSNNLPSPIGPVNAPTLDSMQLYFTLPSLTGGVQPCGVPYNNNITNSNSLGNNSYEYYSLGDVGKVFEYDSQFQTCSQRIVCPGGICDGNFPRSTPDGPINYYGTDHSDYDNITLTNSKDTNMTNPNGYGNDLFCELFNDPNQGGVWTVNRSLEQSSTSFPTTMFGNINLTSDGAMGLTNKSMCQIPYTSFPNGTNMNLEGCGPGNVDCQYMAYNCQIANPQVVPFSSEGSSKNPYPDKNNQVPPGYFFWDEYDANSTANVGDWSQTMTYSGHPIPGISYTVSAQLYDVDQGSNLIYAGTPGPNRTYNMSGAGYNKATQTSSTSNPNGDGNYAVRTFCPSLYGPLGSGQRYCGFAGNPNYIEGDSTFQQYSTVYNGQDPNCATNANLYALANEYSYAQDNWMPEDWKLYYMYLDEYGMDGNGLCPLLGDTCQAPDVKNSLFISPTCVNCLAGNFAYGVMYDGGTSPGNQGDGGGYDAGIASANATPLNMRGNMQSTTYPNFSDPGNNIPPSTSPTVASSLMGCDRMIGYQTVAYNGKSIGVHATCACIPESPCYCWNTAGDWNGNDDVQIYSDQNSSGMESGNEPTCWVQNNYKNNINQPMSGGN